MTPSPEPAGQIPRARLRDVAALAGVSVKTASRALADLDGVKPETVARVRAAAATLRFRPNQIARELRTGAVTRAVGYVIGDFRNPWYSQVADGAERVLHAAGLELIVATTEGDPDKERSVIRAMLERRVQALLIVPVAGDQGYLEGERQLGTPLVFIDRPPANLAADAIVLDNRTAMSQATRQLLEAGHTRIGLVGDDEHMWTTDERIRGFGQEMEAFGLTDWRSLCVFGASDAISARKLTGELLTRTDPPTALLTLHNRITIGALEAQEDSGVRTAIIGFDDFELGSLLKVTVIKHDPTAMGALAAQTALERLEEPSTPVKVHTMPTEIVRRGSGELPPPR